MAEPLMVANAPATGELRKFTRQRRSVAEASCALVTTATNLFNDAQAAQERASALCTVAQSLRAEIAEARAQRQGEDASDVRKLRTRELGRAGLSRNGTSNRPVAIYGK